ncbi:hypothetical protein FH972_020466 [Carpinus fangiana]|uniref:Uncharacterized protein n=1 Tax=Carpinus fangiana TaxID=176857 RepID=A0A5N6RTE2_9ROSI|nr:hypothetical protein FH972_020466 [Carpinus fangiana]
MADQSTMPSIMESKPMHPLHQIAETPTHKLLLKQDKEDEKLLAKCVEELKKKGIKFDLLKEVDTLRRAKSLRVEAKAVSKWSARDFATLFFFAMSCLVLGITRVIDCLCGGGHDNQKEEAGREEEERGGHMREK